MAHQVPWNKELVDAFIEEAYLSDEESKIMVTRARGWTITQQSIAFNMSKSKINKIIARLKVKYDIAQLHSEKLPPRKFSAKETYLDTH